MNFKKSISILTVITLIFSLIEPIHSSANTFSDGEIKDNSIEAIDINTKFVESELEVQKPEHNIKYPELALEETEFSNIPDIQPMCGPPCGLIAVIATRAIVSGVSRAILKNSAGKTIKTLVPAPKNAAANAVKNYTTKSVKANGRTYSVTKTDMKHFLERHSMNHWNGSWAPGKTSQTFFYQGMTIQRLDTIILNGLKQNASKLPSSGFKQFNYTYNNITYVIRVNGTTKRVTQIYPKKTYVNPY